MTFGSGGPSNLIPLPFSRRIGAEATPAFDAESTLAELYQSLGGRAALQRRNEEFFCQLEGLRRETNPELFFEAVANLAASLESGGQSEPAAELYAFLSQIPQTGQALRNRSETQLRAILGRGDFLPRCEHLGRQLASEACDPASLAAMGMAGMAFRLSRFAALSRLAAGTESFFTRGIGARLLAGTAGFLMEVPTFTLAQHGAGAALGREVDWSAAALRRDLASGALMMLSLRGMGALGQTALGRFASRNSLRAGAARWLVPQAAMLGGLVLTRRLEEGLGWRQRQSGATVFADAFATLLQFHAGGRLAQEAFGENFSLQESRIEIQTAILEQWNSPRAQTRSAQASAWRSRPALAALGTGLLTLLQPGSALAQDGPGLGGMHIVDPITIATLSTLLASAAAAYATKRFLNRNQEPSAEFYWKHRGRIIAGRGGHPPTDAVLPGESELIRTRLLNFRDEPLYRKISRSQLEAFLQGGNARDQGAFRSSGFDLPKSIGPRVFEVGVNEDTGELVQILELTEPLPQTPAPEPIGGETYLRIAQLTDLQQYSDAQQCPLLVLPIQKHSEYFLGIPLRHQNGSGYLSTFFQNGFQKIAASNFMGLGGLGNLLDGAMGHSAPRSFIIDNDGEGYLLLDRDGAQLEFVQKARQEAIQREGARVNGKTLAGDHPGLPLNSGDRIESGEFQMQFLAPRPAFPLGLLRTLRKPIPIPIVTSEEGNLRGRWLLEQTSLRHFTGRIDFRELFPARRYLPDMVMQALNGDRIVLSPRLSGDGRAVPVGANPGLQGIYLHGAWNPRAPRYSIAAEDIEFFLHGEAVPEYQIATPSTYYIRKNGVSTLRLLRNGIEVPLDTGESVALQDNDILEVGPASQRIQFRWFHDLDARETLP